MHLHAVAKNMSMSAAGEEIRRAVRAVEDVERPLVGQLDGAGRSAGGAAASPPLPREPQARSTSPGRSAPAAVAAEPAEREGRAAAEIVRRVDAAAHGR